MSFFPKPAAGSWTENWPELGTAPVNYEDSISEEFFAAERKAVFERSWLCVGRSERLPRKGSYFTRELPGRLASIVVTRDHDRRRFIPGKIPTQPGIREPGR